MSVVGVLAMLVVVVSVALVRPTALQATLYSLPIPLTVGLASLSGSVSTLQPLSAFAAIGFFFLAAWLRDLVHNRFIASLAAGAVAFVALIGLNQLPQAGVWPPICIAIGGWVPIAVFAIRHLNAAVRHPPEKTVGWRNLLASVPMFLIAIFAAPLAGSLAAMFPFAGLAVSTAIPGRLWLFAYNFALRAIGLIGYCSAYVVSIRLFDSSPLLAFLVSWIVYLILLLGALALRKHWPTRRHVEVADE